MVNFVESHVEFIFMKTTFSTTNHFSNAFTVNNSSPQNMHVGGGEGRVATLMLDYGSDERRLPQGKALSRTGIE